MNWKLIKEKKAIEILKVIESRKVFLVFLFVSFVYLLYSFFLFLPFLKNDFLIVDDARLWIAPFYTYIYPENFVKDLISEYLLSIQPLGFWAIYRLSLPIIDPLYFSKILTLLLIIGIWIISFLTGKAIGGRICGLFTLLLVARSDYILDRAFGALPRGFAFLLLLLFVFLWIKERHRDAFFVLFFQSLLYPPVFLVCWLASVFIMLIDIRNWISSKKTIILIFVLLTTISAITLFGLKKEVKKFGNMVTLEQAEKMSEWSRYGGRFPELPFTPDGKFIAKRFQLGFYSEGYSEGYSFFPSLVKTHYEKGNYFVWIYFIVLVLAPFLVRPKPYWWFGLIFSSVFLYFMAKTFAFHLFKPDRFVDYSLPLVAILLFPLAWRAGKQWILFNLPIFNYICIGLFLAVFVFYPVGFSGLKGKTLDSTTQKELLTFVKGMSEPAFFAGWPKYDMDNLPLLAHKKVLVNYESAHPTLLGYYGKIKERMYDNLKLYFATDLETMVRIRDKYDLTHLIVEREFLRANNLIPYIFEPFYSMTIKLKWNAMQKGFFFANPPPNSIIFATDEYFIIDLRKVY